MSREQLVCKALIVLGKDKKRGMRTLEILKESECTNFLSLKDLLIRMKNKGWVTQNPATGGGHKTYTITNQGLKLMPTMKELLEITK